MEKKVTIIFSESVKDKMISSLGYKKSKDGFLVDRKNKIVTSQDFQGIPKSNFGGVLQGSKIPIKKEESELVKYFISGSN